MAPPSQVIARWVSIIGHPMALVPLAIAVAGARDLRWTSTAAILGLVGAALAVVAIQVRRGVRAGRFSDVDLTRREQRGSSYLLGLLLAAAVLVALRLMGHRGGGAVGALVLLAVAALVNLKLKASLHVAFALYAAALVGPRSPVWLALFLAAAALVAWSRLALGRHTVIEVIAGAAIGALGGGLALFL